MTNTIKIEINLEITPFLVQDVVWDLTMDDPEEECEGDVDDLPKNGIVWLWNENIKEIKGEDGEFDEEKLTSMIADTVSDDWGSRVIGYCFCVRDIGSWRQIDLSEAEALLAAA